MGSNSGMDMKKRLFPLPSWPRLQARLPDWTRDEKRGLASWCQQDLQVILGSFGSDGMALKPEVHFEQTKLRFGGAQGGPVSVEDVLAGVDLVDLASRMYTEGGAIVVSTVCNKMAFIAGTEGILKKGDGNKVRQEVEETIRTLQTCRCCLDEGDLPQEDMVLTNPRFCMSTCLSGDCQKLVKKWLQANHTRSAFDATELPPPCAVCAAQGHKTALAQLRRCDRCVEKKRKCVRFAFLCFSMDCASKNKTAMVQWEKDIDTGDIAWDMAMVTPLPDYLHVLKTLFMGMLNWFLMYTMVFFFLEMLWVLYEDPTLAAAMVALGVTRNAVRCRDRMGTEEIPQRSGLWKLIKEKVQNITCTLVPSIRRKWEVHLYSFSSLL